MNKKLLTYFLLLFLAVAMPSCSNDNDNDEPESSVEDLIVGVWKEEFDDDGSYSMLTFNNDGTYAYTIQEKYAEQEGYNTYKEYGTYVIQKSSLYRNKYILTFFIKGYAENIQEDLLIASISKSKLILSSEDKHDKATEFTRVE